MDGIWIQLALVGGLVLVNAAFAGTELALVSLRPGQITRLERRSRTGRTLAELARNPNRFLATIQIGITLAGFLASASAAVALAEPLQERLGFLGTAARPGSIIAVTVILSYVTLVVGELAPKRLAMQWAEGWAMAAARPLRLLSTLARPVVWLLSRSTDQVVRIFGGNPDQGHDDVTEEELRDLVAAQKGFSPDQRSVIGGAFDVAERAVEEVLRPRPEVLVLDSAQPCRQAIEAMVASGRSRAPVAAGANLDDTVGVVHLRDLLVDQDRPVGEVAKTVLMLPDSVGVLDALRQMQAHRAQLAVAIDEHGGAEGIVTVEDLLEEIVGEIYDESDHVDADVDRGPDGTLTVSGRLPVHELRAVGVEVPDGDYVTVAGLVLARLGHIPEGPGDAIEVDGRRFTIAEVEGNAITRVHIAPGP